MKSVIRLDSVGRDFGTQRALDEVSMDIAGGERVALLGHNGAGKTTLMKLALGLKRPSRGQVRVLGEDPAGGNALQVRRAIGFLPENIVFDNAMTGREAIRFYAHLKQRPASECERLLQRVGLTDSAGRRIYTYSKGMRQRLGLAQALLGRPAVLLLDEPTTGLDPELRVGFFQLLQELSEAGTAVLLSSHALTELEERTDRIAIMKQGRLVAVGSLSLLREQARLPVRFTLRVAPPLRDSVIERLGRREARPEGQSRLVLECAAPDKMACMAEIIALGDAVEDLDMVPPSLDEIYAHYVGEAG